MIQRPAAAASQAACPATRLVSCCYSASVVRDQIEGKNWEAHTHARRWLSLRASSSSASARAQRSRRRHLLLARQQRHVVVAAAAALVCAGRVGLWRACWAALSSGYR